MDPITLSLGPSALPPVREAFDHVQLNAGHDPVLALLVVPGQSASAWWSCPQCGAHGGDPVPTS